MTNETRLVTSLGRGAVPGQKAPPATWPPARRHRTSPLFSVSPPAGRKAAAPSGYVPEIVRNRPSGITAVTLYIFCGICQAVMASSFSGFSATAVLGERATSRRGPVGPGQRGPMLPVGARTPSAPKCFDLVELIPQPPPRQAQDRRLRAYHPPAARAATAATSPARAT